MTKEELSRIEAYVEEYNKKVDDPDNDDVIRGFCHGVIFGLRLALAVCASKVN